MKGDLKEDGFARGREAGHAEPVLCGSLGFQGPGSFCLSALHPQSAGRHPQVHHLLVLRWQLHCQAGRTDKKVEVVLVPQKQEGILRNILQTSIYVSMAGTGSCGHHQV